MEYDQNPINQSLIQKAHTDYHIKTRTSAKMLKDDLKNCYLTAMRDKEQIKKL